LHFFAFFSLKFKLFFIKVVKSGAKSKNKEIHSKSVAFHAKNQQKKSAFSTLGAHSV
jgi:hypothetical protein